MGWVNMCIRSEERSPKYHSMGKSQWCTMGWEHMYNRSEERSPKYHSMGTCSWGIMEWWLNSTKWEKTLDSPVPRCGVRLMKLKRGTPKTDLSAKRFICKMYMSLPLIVPLCDLIINYEWVSTTVDNLSEYDKKLDPWQETLPITWITLQTSKPTIRIK